MMSAAFVVVSSNNYKAHTCMADFDPSLLLPKLLTQVGVRVALLCFVGHDRIPGTKID
jgi:hypothetical protein